MSQFALLEGLFFGEAGVEDIALLLLQWILFD